MGNTKNIIDEFAKLNSMEKVEILSQLYWMNMSDGEKDMFLREIEN